MAEMTEEADATIKEEQLTEISLEPREARWTWSWSEWRLVGEAGDAKTQLVKAGQRTQTAASRRIGWKECSGGCESSNLSITSRQGRSGGIRIGGAVEGSCCWWSD
jgi:hypothetical protein